MARMPGAEWVGEHGSVSMSEASLNKICVHTIVGKAPAHAAHLSVAGSGKKFQSRDTRYQSDANLYGNDDVIAIECEDMGPEFPAWGGDPKKVPEFTNAQMWSIAEILVWGHFTHGIPLVPCPDSKDSSEGIAYHRQGIDGNFLSEGYAYPGRVPGGEVWTKHFGKACPGDKRITQLLTIIIPRARQLAGIDPMPIQNNEEDYMYFLKGGTGLDDCEVYLQTGPFFIGLTGGATADARKAYKERGAPFQWVTQVEVDDLDRRSHALFDKGASFDLLKEHSSLLRDVTAKLGELASLPPQV